MALLTGGTKVIHGSFVVSLYLTDNKPKRAVYNIYNNIYYIYTLTYKCHTLDIYILFYFIKIREDFKHTSQVYDVEKQTENVFHYCPYETANLLIEKVIFRIFSN